MKRHVLLEELIAPVVTGLGFTFEGLQYLSQGKHSLLRIYVDKPEGVTIDDCAIVSRQVDAVLSVKTPIQGEYTLEVSSPGIDRLLFTPAQFCAQKGKMIAIRIIVPVEGKRNFKGVLENADEEQVVIRMDNDPVTLAFTNIVEARVVPEW